MFARRRISVIHGEIIRLNDGAERNSRKIRRLTTAIGPWNKTYDFCAHDNPSQMAIVTSPANASDSRYAVIRSFSQAK